MKEFDYHNDFKWFNNAEVSKVKNTSKKKKKTKKKKKRVQTSTEVTPANVIDKDPPRVMPMGHDLSG